MADLTGLSHAWKPTFIGGEGEYECPHCLRSVAWPVAELCPALVSARLGALAAQAEEKASWPTPEASEIVGRTLLLLDMRRKLLTWVQRLERIKGASPPYIGQSVTEISREIYAYGAHPNLTPEPPAAGKDWPWVPVHWTRVDGLPATDILDAFRLKPGVPNEDEGSIAHKAAHPAIHQIEEWLVDLESSPRQPELYLPLTIKRIAKEMREYCAKAKSPNGQEPK